MGGSLKYKIKSQKPRTQKKEYLPYDSVHIKFKTGQIKSHCLGIYTWGKTINESKETNTIKVKTAKA